LHIAGLFLLTLCFTIVRNGTGKIKTIMAVQTVKISDVKSNPNNPRLIKDDKFKKLVQSLKDFPEMANVRPIVVNQDFVVLGGNMRLKAMKEAGWKEVPVEVVDWPEEKQREFIIKDNVGFGEWEWDVLANEWEADDLEKWGLDIPNFESEPTGDDLIGDEKNKPATLKITFQTPEQLQKAEIDIQELLDRKYQGAYFSVSAGEI
jgi:hypothetical protein